MNYLVMECHPSYAIVLDEEGRFLAVANLQYEVGQRVSHVVEISTEKEKPKKKNRFLPLLSMAAALVLIVTMFFKQSQPVLAGSIYLSINPDVRIDVDREDRVISVQGENADGKKLIEAYDPGHKESGIVIDELIDRSMEQGYLEESGNVAIHIEGEDAEWKKSAKRTLKDHLTAGRATTHHLTISFDDDDDDKQIQEEDIQIIIPIEQPKIEEHRPPKEEYSPPVTQREEYMDDDDDDEDDDYEDDEDDDYEDNDDDDDDDDD